MAADAIHDEHREREEHALPQLGDGEQVLDAVDSHVTFYVLLSTFHFLLSTFEHLSRAAGSRNLLCGLAAELVRADREPLRDFAASQHLYKLRGRRNETPLAQQIDRHDRSRIKALAQRVEVHDRVLYAERIVESTLRHAAL